MKKFMAIVAPVSSRSGYGAHARDLVKSFIDIGEYDIKINDVPWGSCPRNALDKNNSEDKKILDCILDEPKLDKQPDIYVDIRIPNEFEQHGKFNIGITAGVETTAVSQVWLDGCNKMDLLIVPSEHSKTGFVQSLYEQMKKLPDGGMQKLGELKLEKPIEVLFEGADEDIYKPIENASLDLVDDIKEDFAFLSVGQWGNAPFGEDRKDIGTLVKLFYEAFANKKNIPALILKTNGATYSILDREDCLLKLNMIKKQFPSDWKLPNVYLLHGDFTDVEMNKLYNHPKIKSFVTFTHGEGFGRPLLEASMTGLPIIAPAWGGQVDFLNSEQSLIVPGEVREVPKSAVWENIIIPESKWYYVDNNLGYKALTLMFENIEEYQQKAKKQQSNNSNLYTLNKMTKKLSGIMKKYTNNISSQVELKLPKLKKVKETI
tara:strand:+ start:330 stop:1625 length:1296 start_codon:yes stop_codon:yes gene_type:complete